MQLLKAVQEHCKGTVQDASNNIFISLKITLIAFNPLVTNGLSHCYHLDESTFGYVNKE